MERPVAIIFHRFGPYHCARVRAVAAKVSAVGIEVVRKDSTYQWDVIHDPQGFRRVTLFPELEGNQPSLRELRRRLYSCLEKEHPRAVAIPGWSAPYALLALNWCLQRAVPAVLMSESAVLDKRRISLAERVKGRLLRLYSSALVGGSRHAQYLDELGFPRSAMFTGYDVVDNAHFAQFESGSEGGLGAGHSFLACCRFVPVKNLPRLLQAYARYRQAAGSRAWGLVLAGDGPEREKLSRLMTALDLNGLVRIPGFVQYDDLRGLYARAGAFILPSVSEPWGLVVNEAMAAGLPVLVSNRCGCAPDLVEEGRNGFTFDPYDIEGLARLMVRMSTMSDAERAAMGQASREIISRWTPETFATNLVKAVEAALAAPRPKATLLDKFLLWALIHLPRALR
jgi:1,2-diacylglycerol 3-alpha-glucosyltransferase